MVKGVFDDASYSMALLAVALMVTVTWCIVNREKGPGVSFSTTLLHMAGNSLNQPLNAALFPRSTTGQAVVIFFSLYNMTICLMYTSVVISIMTSIKDPQGIELMSDLNKTENRGCSIVLANLV